MAIIPYRRSRSSSPALTTGIDEFDRFVDNFFNQALTGFSGQSRQGSEMSLRMDITETDDAYLIKADLPGVKEEDIDITLEEGMLTISGEKEQESEEEGKTFHRIERSWGSFQRSLALPADADENKIDARMENGILEVEIGKSEEKAPKSKRIEVRAGNGKEGKEGQERAGKHKRH